MGKIRSSGQRDLASRTPSVLVAPDRLLSAAVLTIPTAFVPVILALQLGAGLAGSLLVAGAVFLGWLGLAEAGDRGIGRVRTRPTEPERREGALEKWVDDRPKERVRVSVDHDGIVFRQHTSILSPFEVTELAVTVHGVRARSRWRTRTAPLHRVSLVRSSRRDLVVCSDDGRIRIALGRIENRRLDAIEKLLREQPPAPADGGAPDPALVRLWSEAIARTSGY